MQLLTAVITNQPISIVQFNLIIMRLTIVRFSVYHGHVMAPKMIILLSVYCNIHVIPPSSLGRLQEMSPKIGKNSSKM